MLVFTNELFSPTNTCKIKDHYQTLEVTPKATTEEIKKSFRRLAHEYHPDKNQSNAFAEARFIAIHEAYKVLSNPDQRSLYDYERWLSGRFTKSTSLLNPENILLEIQKLNRHIGEIDVYRMNKQLLHEYLLYLLNDERVAILLNKGNPSINGDIIKNILQATVTLPTYYSKKILTRLLETIAVDNSDIIMELHKIKKQEQWQKAYPWLIVAITLLICLAMFLFSKK